MNISKNKAVSKSKVFRFFDLPAELRYATYQHLAAKAELRVGSSLTTGRHITVFDLPSPKTVKLYADDPSLAQGVVGILQANRQAREEALFILFRSCSVGLVSVSILHTLFHTSLAIYLPAIRNLELELYRTTRWGGVFADAARDRATEAVKACSKLQEVDFMIGCCSRGSTSRCCWEEKEERILDWFIPLMDAAKERVGPGKVTLQTCFCCEGGHRRCLESYGQVKKYTDSLRVWLAGALDE